MDRKRELCLAKSVKIAPRHRERDAPPLANTFCPFSPGHHLIRGPGRASNGDMLHAAEERGLKPAYTEFDSWYTSLDNLMQLREMGWRSFARVRENGLVATHPNSALSDFVAVSTIEIPSRAGSSNSRTNYGPVRVFRTVRREDGEFQYWATDGLGVDAKKRDDLESRDGASRSTTVGSSGATG